MSNWTQPLCDGCWIRRYSDRTPTRLRDPEAETCCICGNGTYSGIYIRIDPTTVKFPTPEDDED